MPQRVKNGKIQRYKIKNMTSSSPRKSPDVQASGVRVEFNYPNDPNLAERSGVLVTNSRIFVHLQVENGSWRSYPLAKKGAADEFSAAFKMPDGASYSYKYVIKTPGQADQWEPPGGPESNMSGIAEQVPEPSPSPRAPIENVRRIVEGGVKNLFEAADTRQSAQDFPLRLRRFQRELESRLSISTDITPLVLGACSKAIRENKKYPQALRDLFPEDDLPDSFDELEERLVEGAAAYHETVFFKLLEDADSRKEFGLRENSDYNPDDPFGNRSKNELFFQYCNARCLMGIGPALSETLGAVASNPNTNPDAIANMNALMVEVANRLPPDARKKIAAEILENVPENRARTALDVLINGGITASLFFAPGAAFAAAAIKGGLEGLTGMKLVDLLRLRRSGGGKEIGSLLAKNNILVDAITAKGTVKDSLKSRLLETLGRALPIANLFFSHKDVAAHGTYKAPDEKTETKAVITTPASLLKKACDAAMK